MEINIITNAIFAILKERFPKAGSISITTSNNIKCLAGEYSWYATVEIQKDIDMVDFLEYSGGGSDFYAAILDVYQKVVFNFPGKG